MEPKQVRYAHLRRADMFEGTDEMGPLMNKHVLREDGFELAPHGGKTMCELTFPNGLIVTAEARCSARDSYNKKIGRDISYGRARKKAAEKLERAVQ